mmetsp:Transcript_9835/g.41835  ORF Transcript_9835/g.41835 Transcript_9835/m.41835 type:complete len:316 (-) Transcript_9835:9-956(-)
MRGDVVHAAQTDERAGLTRVNLGARQSLRRVFLRDVVFVILLFNRLRHGASPVHERHRAQVRARGVPHEHDSVRGGARAQLRGVVHGERQRVAHLLPHARRQRLRKQRVRRDARNDALLGEPVRHRRELPFLAHRPHAAVDEQRDRMCGRLTRVRRARTERVVFAVRRGGRRRRRRRERRIHHPTFRVERELVRERHAPGQVDVHDGAWRVRVSHVPRDGHLVDVRFVVRLRERVGELLVLPQSANAVRDGLQHAGDLVHEDLPDLRGASQLTLARGDRGDVRGDRLDALHETHGRSRARAASGSPLTSTRRERV